MMRTIAGESTHGAPGSPIPGSRYVRDYCCCCGEPIRVFLEARRGGVICAECVAKDLPRATCGVRGNVRVTVAEMAYHGGRFSQGEW